MTDPPVSTVSKKQHPLSVARAGEKLEAQGGKGGGRRWLTRALGRRGMLAGRAGTRLSPPARP